MRTFSRKMLAVMLAVLMICVMAPVSAIAADLGTTDNLIQNGDFETGNNTGWSLYQSTKVDAAAAKDGSYGLHIAGNGGWGGMGTQIISGLEIGQVYRFSYDYKAISSGVNVKLCAGASDSAPEYAYIYANKTEWTKYTVEFEATTTNACFALVGSGTGVAEEMYMDNISLTKVVLGAEDDDPNRKTIDTLKSNIKTQGRTAMVGGTLMLDFSISGMEFELDCEGDVYASFNARKLNDGGVYFTILVDGVRQDRLNITSIGETKVKLASNLPAGKHTFAIYRQSEHSFGEIGVCALSYVGEMLAKPADKGLYVEFIGDSISCGYGNIGNDGSAISSDGTQAYTYLTAQALGADWSNVAWSGIGCKYGYGTITMQDVYPIQRYNYDKTTAYDFSNQPDIVILALGTNDNSIQSDATLKRAGLVEMLTLVREKNPNAPIVWIHGMMTNGVSAMIEEIVAEFGGAEAGYYACRLTQNNAGGGSHPNLAGQQTFADELVAFIQANGLDVVEPAYNSIISGGETSRTEETKTGLGLAFRFEIAANGIAVEGTNTADLTNATVDALGDGNGYKLVDMGAVVSNDLSVGRNADKMTLDHLSGKTIQIKAVYLQDLEADSAAYAVRVINIPEAQESTLIFARAYYVVEIEGERIIVYGDIYEANYAGKIEVNDGVLEW
ncbi:MAG: carbohydrate binding domain-containing protein [Clostridia bacterium]|nr:carbohydrate binding domain-containing protein [Clostridia bacterium]